jgi:hypothetical protein
MLENAIRAARLDVDFYNTVENDPSFTQQAGLLVAVVGLLTGIGNSFVLKGFFLPIIWGVVGALIGWVVWSFVTDFVGRTFFGGESDLGQMMRVLGFAQAPLVLGIIPFLGFIGAIWALVAAVVAIREGQDFTTGKAVGTVIVGWIAYAIVFSIVYAIV